MINSYLLYDSSLFYSKPATISLNTPILRYGEGSTIDLYQPSRRSCFPKCEETWESPPILSLDVLTLFIADSLAIASLESSTHLSIFCIYYHRRY